jgi:hypothetical protein
MITAISRLDCGSQADPYTQDTLTSDPDELVEDEDLPLRHGFEILI